MGTGGPNKLVEAGYLIRPPVIVAYLTQANDIHRISGLRQVGDNHRRIIYSNSRYAPAAPRRWRDCGP